MTLELLAGRADGVTFAALADGSRLIDLAGDCDGEIKLYNSLWRVRIDRILPKVGAFAALDDSRSGLLKNHSLKSGDSAIVQVRSVRSEGKADILSTDIALTGRLFVYLPLSPGLKSSRRAGNPANAAQALAALETAGIEGGILRSAAHDSPVEDLIAEANTLKKIWHATLAASGYGLLRDGPDAAARVLADNAGRDVRISSATFEQRGLDSAIARLRQPRVELGKGGASLMIERTSALTAIDVNTGTASPVETNAAAAREIAAQIRLRNLSGLIVIDFASPGPKHKGDGLYQALQKALEPDPAGCRIAGVTPSGLVELARPRRDPPLAELLEKTSGVVT